MTDQVLSVQGLRVAHGPVTAVHSLDLAVDRGEILALVGPNGAGKTSTVAAIAGLIRPAAGVVLLDGRPITGRAPEQILRRGLSLVPEGRNILSTLTVEENLRLGASARRDRPGVRADLAAAKERFPILGSRAHQPAGLLSGGEQQQLAIARALMSRAHLLLLDEPSLGLAPLMIDAVFDTIVALRAEGVTIVLIEQNASRAVDIADRSVVLRNGVVVAAGARDDIGLDLSAQYLGTGAAR